MKSSRMLVFAVIAALLIAFIDHAVRQDAGNPPPPAPAVRMEGAVGAGTDAASGGASAESGSSLPAMKEERSRDSAAGPKMAEEPAKDGRDAAAAGEGAATEGDDPVNREEEKEADDGRMRNVTPEGDVVVRGRVEAGTTPDKILDEAGAGDGTKEYLRAAHRVFSLKKFQAGRQYVVVTDPAGRVKRFEYEVDDRRRLVVEGLGSPVARLERIPLETRLALVEGVIADSLFDAVADMGERPQLALRIAALFASEINFVRSLREGDSFSVLVEKLYRDGVFKGYGAIPAARFTNRGKTYEAWLFRDANGDARHFNSKGESLRKTLLQAPLSILRVTSRFSHSRRHPILGFSRPHMAVDYGAPAGTPVMAVGHGEVVAAAPNGGYGHQIVVRHSAGLESMYSHLSGYARGVRRGARVRQGQIIGYVGSTGLSTGPHLDFRIRRKGVFVDPTKVVNPRDEGVPQRRLKEFFAEVERCRAFMSGARPLSDYRPLASSAAPSGTADVRPAASGGGRIGQADRRKAVRKDAERAGTKQAAPSGRKKSPSRKGR